jgi:hypothetical protein
MRCYPDLVDFVLTGIDGDVVRKEIRDGSLIGKDPRERYDIGERPIRSVKIE